LNTTLSCTISFADLTEAIALKLDVGDVIEVRSVAINEVGAGPGSIIND